MHTCAHMQLMQPHVLKVSASISKAVEERRINDVSKTSGFCLALDGWTWIGKRGGQKPGNAGWNI